MELMARSSEVNVDVYGKSSHIAKAGSVKIESAPGGFSTIQCGTTNYITCFIKNEIDNYSVPKHERSLKIYQNVTNGLYISNYGEKDNIYRVIPDREGFYSFSLSYPIYNLDISSYYVIDASYKDGYATSKEISFDVNISKELWNTIAGNEVKQDTIVRYLWFVTGLSKNNKENSLPSTKSL